jgi:hypothetical protein
MNVSKPGGGQADSYNYIISFIHSLYVTLLGGRPHIVIQVTIIHVTVNVHKPLSITKISEQRGVRASTEPRAILTVHAGAVGGGHGGDHREP